MKHIKIQVFFLLILLPALVINGAELSKGSESKEAIIKKMQKGGLVMYFRHASTEKDYADQVKANVNDGSTQRVLSEKDGMRQFILEMQSGFIKYP